MHMTPYPPRVGTTQIGTEPRRAQRRPWRRWRAALLAAAMAAGVVALGLSTAQAGATAGTVPEVRLASDAAGALTISWDSPASAPSDYRVMWAEATQDYLSWKADNETTRGNSYPEGTATSLTLTGLTEGAEYKVRVRSRYRSGGPHGPWSGPWTDEATLQVSRTQAADRAGHAQRTALGTRSDPQLFTPDTKLDPPLIISDDEDDENLQFAAQDAAQGLTSEVEAPSAQAVTFVSNTSQIHANYEGVSASSPRATPFMTGSSTDGYELTSVKVSLAQEGTVFVAVHANGAGNLPGAQVGQAFGSETYDHGTSVAGEVTFSGSSVRLAPGTNYWLVLSVAATNSGQPAVWFSNLGQGVDSGGQSGWALGGRYHAYFDPWEAGQLDAPLAVKLSGTVPGPEGVDFSANSSTVGRLEVGTLSSGFLSSSADRDLFKLEDLPATSNSARDGQKNKWSRKRYRVQAWFGDHAPGVERGGEVFIMEASPSGSSSLYSSVSDTNEDGLSLFEFEAFPNIDYYVMVVPTAATQVLKLTVVSGDIVESYALDSRTYTGAYKLKIDDVSHIEEMATTLHLAQPSGVRRVKVTTGSTGPSIPVADRVAGLDRTVAFRTGANSGGYVLNRVEAAVSETEISQFPANAKVSIYSDGTSGSPGSELFTLKTPADIWAGGFDDYEESFWVPSGTTANLAATTWYWVVFAMNSGASLGAYRLDLVDSATADVKSGWIIHEDSRTRSRTIANDPWTLYASDSTNRSIQIGVYASPNTGTDHKNPVPLDTAPTGGS